MVKVTLKFVSFFVNSLVVCPNSEFRILAVTPVVAQKQNKKQKQKQWKNILFSNLFLNGSLYGSLEKYWRDKKDKESIIK